MKKLKYWKKEKGKEGEIYSCDKMQLVFNLRYTCGQKLLDDLSVAIWLNMTHWESRKFNSYRNQFSIEVGEDSFWLGVGMTDFNGKLLDVCKLEFNPNKVYPSRPLCWLLNRIWRYTKLKEPVRLKQWDLAIDYPVERRDLSLQKDGRLYEEQRKSKDDCTQYLGQRNKPGRVKLYNKTVESGLETAVSRLEITVEGLAAVSVVAQLFPVVYRLQDFQIGMECAGLNDTDKFIFKTLLASPDRICELGRRKREKMEELLKMSNSSAVLRFDEGAYRAMLAAVAEFMVCPGERADGLDRAKWEHYGVPEGYSPAGDVWDRMERKYAGQGNFGTDFDAVPL